MHQIQKTSWCLPFNLHAYIVLKEEWGRGWLLIKILPSLKLKTALQNVLHTDHLKNCFLFVEQSTSWWIYKISLCRLVLRVFLRLCFSSPDRIFWLGPIRALWSKISYITLKCQIYFHNFHCVRNFSCPNNLSCEKEACRPFLGGKPLLTLNHRGKRQLISLFLFFFRLQMNWKLCGSGY